MKVNRIIAAFLSFVFVMWLVFIFIIQSGTFSVLVRDKINHYVQSKIDANFNVGNVRVRVFLPGLILNNVNFKFKVKDAEINLTLKKLEFNFSMFNFFIKGIHVQNTLLSNGEITIKTNKSSGEKVESVNEKIIREKIFGTFSKVLDLHKKI